MDLDLIPRPGGPALTGEDPHQPTERPLEQPFEVEPVAEPPPDRWGGLPPVGKRPIGDRWAYAGEVVSVFFVWLAVWAVYRYIRTISRVDETVLGPLLSIIAPVVLTLSIPLIWWRYRRRERGIPFLITHRNLFTSVLVACAAVVAFFIFFYLSYPVLLAMMDVETEGDLSFWAIWRAESATWLIATTLFYMIIVGPVEELFHRGFIQDQVNRAFAPIFGILIASVVFVLGHVPIDFMVYQLTLSEWGLRWLSSFPFAVGMGVFYHWSRDIWGVAVYHGLYDWFLTVNNLEYGLMGPELALGQYYFLYFVWFSAELAIIIAFAYVGYRLWWRGSRPAGSLGFLVRGVSHPTSPDRKWMFRVHAFLTRRPFVAFARVVDRFPRWKPEILSLALIGVILFGNLFLTGALGSVPPFGGGPGDVPGPWTPGADDVRTLPTETEHAYVYEGETRDFAYQQGIDRKYVSINVTLTWQDEAPPTRYTNEPDTLRVELQLDDGTVIDSLAMDGSSAGSVVIEWTAESPVRGEGVIVSVTAVECGNMVPTLSPLGLRERADDGNNFDMAVEITIWD
ncbi:MAG: CPBP family intramembrane metalloprotease [Thermoplasmata archaeon]|nr:CPBP family intramembrane metalloprotease [Thermoplasmata archaeon]